MKVRIKFLGSGQFAEQIKQVLTKRFELVEENPDLQIVANYGRILTKQEIEAPRYGTINVHPSCLPKYRGSTPLQNAILNNDNKTCVCIIKMVEKVDAGAILACEDLQIESDDTFESLSLKAGKLAAQMLPLVIIQYVSGSISPKKQNDADATFVKKLTREDGLLDLSKSVEKLERQIRAHYPWPGSFLILPDETRLIVHKAHVDHGKLVPDLVQKEGKKIVSWEEFKLGYRAEIPPELN